MIIEYSEVSCGLDQIYGFGKYKTVDEVKQHILLSIYENFRDDDFFREDDRDDIRDVELREIKEFSFICNVTTNQNDGDLVKQLTELLGKPKHKFINPRTKQENQTFIFKLSKLVKTEAQHRKLMGYD